jgi:predicted transcriptional regulator
MPSGADGGAVITAAHVQWAAGLLSAIYDAPENGLARVAQADRADRTQLPDVELENMYEALLQDIPEIYAILKGFAMNPCLTTTRIAAQANVSVRTIGGRVQLLKNLGLVTSHGRGGVKATPLMRQLIHYQDQQEAGTPATLAP